MNQSVIDRAWGFTRTEYVEAYSRVKPRPLAEKVFAKVFDDLEKDPGSSIGGDNALFALLSLVSPDCRKRVLEITRWSESELSAQQEASKSASWDADIDDTL